MSEHDSHTPDRDEFEDQLIDAGLRELVGGERPPELTERILAAATASATLSPSGEDAMSEHNTTSAPRRRARFGWTSWAIAATLLVGAGWLLLPDTQSAREAARSQQERFDAKIRATAATAPQAKEDNAERIKRNANELMMLVTPHVIIEEDGERLGDDVQEGGGQPAASALAAQQLIAPAEDAEAMVGYSIAEAFESRFASGTRGGRAAQQLYYGEGAPQAGSNAARLKETNQLSLGVDVNSDAGARSGYFYSKSQQFLAKPGGNGALPFWQKPAVQGQGQGPDLGGDQYARIFDNPFQAVSAATTDNRLSTFSIDVDTASYANVRQFIMQSGALPPPDAVRIEELVNYFDYDYSPPTDDTPFAANVEVAQCPWKPEHRLVRIGIKGRDMDRSQRPQSNLVFLIDVSGSMDEPNKLPLLLEGMRLLTRELGENDRVAIVVYASSEGLALESTPGTDQSKILAALDELRAGGSTAGGAGIQLAYQMAADNFIKGAVNRVILCTDGDFNVGVTSPAELERMAETQAKETGVFLTVLGFGRGNLNDAMMEQIADKGNGNYHYVDNRGEARKVLVEEMTGTLVTIAKDVKIQVEFNPAHVGGYRLIGYENRVLAAEDFNDDKKDAGEIGAGHTVTALYEIVPPGEPVDAAKVDELKYGEVASATAGAAKDSEDAKDSGPKPPTDELLTVKIRYKQPDGDESTKLEFPISDGGEVESLHRKSDDFQFAAAVASFGMLLRGSEHKGNATYAAVAEIAESASRERDPHGYRKEFVEIVRRAKELAGE